MAQDPDGSLVIGLAGRLPVARRSRDVDLELSERWEQVGANQWACADDAYELRHHEIGYRRVLHRHDEGHFVRMHGVATHEHCEATMGVETCGRCFGQPVADGFDAFHRLHDTWLTDQTPDCLALTCLG